ncbi:MAG: T9SS type A sorting domain-containing protein [Bacteroidetes bacterium]|nr:T9SS type A sorting domain-containing protein [Bacteroidota bacterium]
MKNKKITQLILSSLAAIALPVLSSTAQIVGADAYLKGNNVEIGISGLGGFEGAPIDSATVPLGLHYRSNNPYFGFVANPQLNAWASFDGDFFTPGSPENGWGFEIVDTAGVSLANNCASLQQINGAITLWNYTAPQIDCDWEGDATSGTDLHWKISYQLQDNDLFYITTVTVTNNTLATIPELYYYRNLDPDNNIMLSSDYTTQNTIIGQPLCCTYANVSATQTTPWNSYFAFLTEADTNWRASYGGFANRDASNLWNGVGFTQTVGATNFADEAITVSYRIQNLAPGGSEVFKYCTLFNGDSLTVASATTSLNLSSTGINESANLENLVSVYPNPFTDNTTISINKGIHLKNAELIVYNVLGKEMTSVKDIQSHEFKLDKNKLSTGVYLYRVINNGAEIATGKLIIK